MRHRSSKYVLLLTIAIFSLTVLAVKSSSAKTRDCRQYRIDQSIDAKMLWQDISVLSSDDMQGRKSQTSGAKLAREYIQQRFKELDLIAFSNDLSISTQFLAPFVYPKSFSDVEGTNVVGYLPGNLKADKFIVISAHYDHLGRKGKTIFNGADDNASGVAAMLSIAKAIKSSPTRYSIIFLATDAEEQGLYGAKAFVRNPPVEISQIKFNLNLDMLSQGGRRNRLYVSGANSNDNLQFVVAEAIQTAGLCLKKGHRSLRKGYASVSRSSWRGASDHAAFNRANIPFLFVGVSDHRYYHTEDDTAENVDSEFYTAATETSLKILRLMDSLN